VANDKLGDLDGVVVRALGVPRAYKNENFQGASTTFLRLHGERRALILSLDCKHR
jgi:hypothetical protein